MNDIQCGHNPYFNRWFSAILAYTFEKFSNLVTILILIDGFLQWNQFSFFFTICPKSQSLF